MEGKKTLYFGLLGDFNYRAGESIIYGGTLKTGRKTLSLLQYLIVNHNRYIASEELIEKFWPEKGRAPENALRNMLYKVRCLLKEMFPDEEEVLLTIPGGHKWSSDVILSLDTEQLEAYCLKAVKKSGKDALELYRKAIAVYKGDFLSANDSDWAVVSRQYYRTLYLEACKAVLPLLQEEEQWIEIAGICEQAYRIDFTVEDFTAYQMRALIALGQTELALMIYDAYRMRLEQEFELEPGGQIEQIHALAIGIGRKERSADEIFRMVCEDGEEKQAFFCTFDMFQKIVALERRHLLRSKTSSVLAIVSLGKDAELTADTRRLERILLGGLRGGDPVARLEAGSYILMLPGADVENAQMVMGRIDSSFHKIYRRSKARLTYCVTAL